MDKQEKEYQEYLSLRLHEQEKEIDRDLNDNPNQVDDKYGQIFPEDKRTRKVDRLSVTEAPYESPQTRNARKEKQRRDREMQEYLDARAADRDERGVRSGIVHTDYDEYGTLRGGRKSSRKAYRDLKKAAKKVGKAGRPKKRVPAPFMGFLIALVLAAIVAVGGAGMVFVTLASAQNVPIDKNDLSMDAAAASQLDGYRNIAILGTDARADDDDSQVRSDAIIVMSINEETNEVKMFSVFRDTLLDVGEQGLDKITHAYFYGGAQQTLSALNKNLDLNIDEVVVINWKTVAEIIDAVGGIEIDVQESEIEEMNKYIHNTAKNVDGPDDEIEGPGKQTLNGVQAVTYSRIRKDAATGDYRRNERMKLVLSETFKKVKEAGPLKMLSVARHAMPEVKTNISTMELFKLMLHSKSYDMTDSTTGFPYDVGSWTGYGGAGYAWYGPPINLTNNVSKLHGQFFNQEGYEPSATVQEISTAIANLTGLY